MDPLEGSAHRRPRRQRRDVDDRGRRARVAPDPSGHVHAEDGGGPGRTREHRPQAARRREHRGDRGGLRAAGRRHHDDRPRPAAAPRPDRGDPRRGRSDQADPGRRRHRLDLRCDPRDERPPGDRHRRHAGRRCWRPPRCAVSAASSRLSSGRCRAARSTRRASRGSRTSSASSRPKTSRPKEAIVCATGVSNSDLLRGVRFRADSAWTHTLVMCTRCNWVRFTEGIHFFQRERREEVRLPGF